MDLGSTGLPGSRQAGRWPCCAPSLVPVLGPLFPAGASSGPGCGVAPPSPAHAFPVAGLKGLALPSLLVPHPSEWEGPKDHLGRRATAFPGGRGGQTL